MFDMTLCQNAADHLLEAGAISKEYNASDYYTNDYVEKIAWDRAAVEADATAYTCSSPQYKAAN